MSEDGGDEEYDGDGNDGNDDGNGNDEEEKAHLCVDLLLVVAGAEGRKDQVSVVHHLNKIFFSKIFLQKTHSRYESRYLYGSVIKL